MHTVYAVADPVVNVAPAAGRAALALPVYRAQQRARGLREEPTPALTNFLTVAAMRLHRGVQPRLHCFSALTGHHG